MTIEFGKTLDKNTTVLLKNGAIVTIENTLWYKNPKYGTRGEDGRWRDIFPNEISKVLSISGTVCDWNSISNKDLILQLIMGDKKTATKEFIRRYKRKPRII